jgi:uncharacterized membrane protein SpoIIM required for sporulation
MNPSSLSLLIRSGARAEMTKDAAVTAMSRSTTRAMARDGAPAVSNSRSTASGVTTPRPVVTTAPYGTRPVVDIDLFIARNQPAWQRLETLSVRAQGRKIKELHSSELDELIGLYQATSGHLAYARTAYRDSGLLARLTSLVANANAAIYGRRARASTTFARFFVASFPAAVWVCRRAIMASAACLFVPAIAIGVWLANSERALDVAIPQSTQDALIASEFEDYYSSGPAGHFAGRVTVNNIQVSFIAFALGTLVVPGVVLLGYNGINVGQAGGLFVSEGEGGQFFGLILPHGLLELTAVAIAGGAGLRMGWALLAPGDRTRGTALAEEGRRSVALVLGTALVFVVAGLIEGFVTPSPLPTAVRVGLGVAVELLFLTWIVGRGRIAADLGFTGHPADDAAAWDRWRGAPAPARVLRAGP